MSTESSGLYHPYFTEEEIRDLEAVSHDDLTGEIYLQRHLLGLVMSESPPDLDFELLLEDVARYLDHLHTVQKRPGNGLELIGGANEEHLGEVEGQREVFDEDENPRYRFTCVACDHQANPT